MQEFSVNEVWKDVVGYETIYKVSNRGNIKVLARKWVSGRNNKILRSSEERFISVNIGKGRRRVALIKDGDRKTCAVSRLVAQSFISNPENKPEVNHIDGDKTNDNVENLEWCTGSENQIHAFKTGLQKPIRGVENVLSKLTREAVLEIRASAETQINLSKKFNVTPMTISRAKRGLTYT